MTRAEAVAQGLTRYFTGKPCPKGHIAERQTCNYGCIECSKGRQRTPSGREYKRHYEKTPKHRDWRRSDRAFKAKHAPPPLEKDCPPRPADGRCQNPGCRKAALLVMDHDHQTGKFRGWLCKNCNYGIGLFGDTIDGVRGILEYLEQTVGVV